MVSQNYISLIGDGVVCFGFALREHHWSLHVIFIVSFKNKVLLSIHIFSFILTNKTVF